MRYTPNFWAEIIKSNRQYPVSQKEFDEKFPEYEIANPDKTFMDFANELAGNGPAKKEKTVEPKKGGIVKSISDAVRTPKRKPTKAKE